MASRAVVLFALMILAAGYAFAEPKSAVSLVIEPDRLVYTLDEAGPGGVVVNARFVNGSENPVFLVHPIASVPDRYDGKGSFSFEERAGNSEILVYITGPDKAETVLRNNALRGFEPGNKHGLHIPPGGSETVRLGWLGPYFALGMWDGFDGLVFRERGEYSIKVVFRNLFGKALSFGTGADIFTKDTPWTGEAVSNEITVKVE